MKKYYLVLIIILFCNTIFSNCNNTLKNDSHIIDSEETEIDSDESGIDSKEIEVPKISAWVYQQLPIYGQDISRGIQALIAFNWNEIEDANYYKLYRNTSIAGSSDTLLRTEIIGIKSNINQPVYNRNTVYYYWVSAVTEYGESKRPPNGGIKIRFDYLNGKWNITYY